MDNSDEVAVVGVGCRFPGANDLEEFWKILVNGENHVVEVSPERWHLDAFYDPDPDAPGKTYVRKAGFVSGHNEFDNRLFDISDTEAAKMDPQQRFVLECTYMALENGGYSFKSISGSNTGVYIGVMNHDYSNVLASDMSRADNYNLTGGTTSIIAARVSYVFNLLGPSMVIDTACSPSLIALHLASQALRAGECDMAICGGVNHILQPEIFIPLSKARMLSAIGASQAFSESADGYARGEGCGIVVLKRLSDALQNGDRVWAVVMTASNHDGRTANPITAPSITQQICLLDQTYKKYGVNPSEIQYIEAHGTGTPVGDPIEVKSLGSFFGSKEHPVLMGSVKTNIGHLESAAGIAGIIKVLLMMKHETIVPTIQFSRLNSKISLKDVHIKIPSQAAKWHISENTVRLACVNSFGFGGSNCHAILSQHNKATTLTTKPGHSVVTISGNTEEAIKCNVSHMLKTLSKRNIDVKSLSFTSTCRREHHKYRVAMHSSDVQTLQAKLFSETQRDTFIRKEQLNLIFVFCGMGTFWNGMCKGLLASEKVFLNEVQKVDVLLKQYICVSTETELRNSSDFSDPIIGPLVLFSSQVGLVALWRSWGITPNICIGQSVGEVAAAYTAGRLCLEDAIRVIYHRTKLLSTVTGGKMLMIRNFPVERVQEICNQENSKIDLAVHYSPVCCCVAGSEEGLKHMIKMLPAENNDFSVHWLPVTSAFHSSRIDLLTEPLADAIHSLSYTNKTNPNIISTVTGHIGGSLDFVSPEYWSRNVRQPVLFYQAISEAFDDTVRNVFLEIGPKPILKGHQGDVFGNKEVAVLPSLEKESEITCMLSSLCELYRLGIDPVWENIVPSPQRILDEPRYQFQRRRGLYEPAVYRRKRYGLSHVSHPYVRVSDDDSDTFMIDINERDTPFVYEHEVNGKLVIHGALLIEVGITVASWVLGVACEQTQVCIDFVRLFGVERGHAYSLKCEITRLLDNRVIFVFSSQSQLYAYGSARERKQHTYRSLEIPKIEAKCKRKWSRDEFYSYLAQRKLCYGKELQVITNTEANSKESIAFIDVTHHVKTDFSPTTLHPLILDAMMQSVFAVGHENTRSSKLALPFSFGFVTVFHKVPSQTICYSKLMNKTESSARYNLVLFSKEGIVIAEARGFTVKELGQGSDLDPNLLAYELKWTACSRPERTPEGRSELLVIIGENPVVFEKINHHFPNSSFYETNPKDFNIEDLAKSISAFEQHHGYAVTGIIFNQQPGLKNLSSEDTLSYMCLICMNLKDLIIWLAQFQLNPTLYVITENCQPSVVKNQQLTVNVNASVLWGMVRCVAHEFVYPNMYLIDTDEFSAQSADVFANEVIRHPISERIGEARKEILLSGGNLYFSTVTHSPYHTWGEEIVPRIWNNVNRVELTTTADAVLSQEYLRYRESDIDVPRGYVKMSVTRFLRQKPSLYPETLINQPEKNEPWLDVRNPHNVAISLEAEGYLPFSTERYIACYPVKISNEIIVPADVLIRKSDICHFQPGLIATLVLTWHIQECLAQGCYISLIVDEETLGTGIFISKLLEITGNCKTDVWMKSDLRKESLNVKTVLLLCSIDTKLEEAILRNDRPQCHVLAFDGWMRDGLAAMFINEGSHFNITVMSTSQIFSHKYLIKTIPKIKKLLKRKRKTLELLLDSPGKGLFSAFSKGRLDFQNNSSLTVAVCSDNLIRRNAAYLVTGGLGGLGWVTVCFLAEMGAGLVATLSRKSPNKEMRSKIEKLKASSHVTVVSLLGDVTQMASVENAIRSLSSNYSEFPLQGIFHGAGVLKDSVLINMTREKFESVTLPKIMGAYNLHQVTQDLHLDYFIMYSSVISLLGGPGQSNYGAANSFLDTFAGYRRQMNLPGQSINWGPLSVGMAAANKKIAEQIEKIGYLPLDEGQIKVCLRHALFHNPTVICYMDFTWMGKQSSILLGKDIREVMLDKLSELNNGRSSKYSLLDVESITTQPREKRHSLLLEYMIGVLATVLSSDNCDFSSETELNRIGLDSMSAMTLSNQIRSDLHVNISAVQLLEGEKVKSLVDIIDTCLNTCGNQSDARKYNFSQQISPFQENICAKHYRHSGKFDVAFAVEFKFTLHENINFLQEVIHSLIMRNKHLHTIYKFDSHGTIKPTVLKDLNGIGFMEISTTDPENLWKEIHNAAQEPFNLSENIPIKVLCVLKGNTCYVGFIFHQIIFDLISVALVFQELQALCVAKINNSVLSDQSEIDIISEIQVYLESENENLCNFWEAKLTEDTYLPKISFCKHESHPMELFGNFQMEKIKVSSEIMEGLQRITNDLNLTIFGVLASGYQLLLHLISGEVVVPIKTVVNVRSFVRRLSKVISRLVNAVPLIAHIDPNDDTDLFLAKNCKDILECVSNGVYPQQLITGQISVINLQNIFRHAIILEDITELDFILNESKQYGLELLKYGPVQSNTETRLVIWLNRKEKSIFLQLDYLPSLIDICQARAILDSFLKVLEYLFLRPSQPISQLPLIIYEGILKPPSLPSLTQSSIRTPGDVGFTLSTRCNVEDLQKGLTFTKLTRNGGKTVTLKIMDNGAVPQLLWEYTDKNRKRSLPLTDIVKVSWK